MNTDIYNRDVRTRDTILFGSYCPEAYMGGVLHYRGLDLPTLQLMLDLHFAKPDEAQNLCPSIGEIYDFMMKYPDYTAHGYVVSIDRDDYRLSIEGVEKGRKSDSAQETKDFKQTFKYPDSVNLKTMYCWYD